MLDVRPMPDRDSLLREVVVALRQLQIANDQVDDAAARLLGLNRTDARCLDLVLLADGLTAGELAGAAGLSTAATTTVIDRLQSAAYVERQRDPTDRRRVVVTPTQEARDAQDALYTPLAEAGIAMLGVFDSDQLGVLRDFLTSGTELTLEHARALQERPDEE
jgi:DNA-binding MarR family transcriptional regulator